MTRVKARGRDVRTAGWGWIENDCSFGTADVPPPALLVASGLEATVCLGVGSEDLRLENFSLMLLMILDMVVVVIKSEGCGRFEKGAQVLYIDLKIGDP